MTKLGRIRAAFEVEAILPHRFAGHGDAAASGELEWRVVAGVDGQCVRGRQHEENTGPLQRAVLSRTNTKPR